MILKFLFLMIFCLFARLFSSFFVKIQLLGGWRSNIGGMYPPGICSPVQLLYNYTYRLSAIKYCLYLIIISKILIQKLALKSMIYCKFIGEIYRYSASSAK